LTHPSAPNRQLQIQKRIAFWRTPSTVPMGNNDSSDAKSRPAATGFRSDIEGLRAVAVLAVVLFHAGVSGVGGGFVGVDVFFVISGFLITGLLWREASTSGTVRLGGFYGARARRLLPASATVGVVTVIASALLLPLQARTIIGDGIASALYVSNFWFAAQGTDYFVNFMSPSPFLHYWSLGVEEQFYLLWPGLIIGTAWLVRRVRKRTGVHATLPLGPFLVVLALVGAMSFAVSLVSTHTAPMMAFFSLSTRAWELAAGGLVALTATQWRRLPTLPATIAGWAGLALILLACTRLDATTTPYPGIAALLPVIGAALVIGAGCATPSRGCGRALALSPMRAIGRVSYSWYLWHWPVLVLAPAFLGHPLGLAARLAGVVVSGGLAVLTLRLIENPLRFTARVRRSAAGSLAVGGAATAVAVCVGVVLLVLLPVPVGRGPAAPALTVTAEPPPVGSNVDLYDAAVQDVFAQVQAAVAVSAGLKAVPSNLDPPLANTMDEFRAFGRDSCFTVFLLVGQPECATGETASATTVALVGDSNAWMWGPAFQQVAAQRKWRLETLTKSACPMLDLPIINPLLHREYTECGQWRGQIIARLRAEHPRLVVLGMWRRYGARYGWASGLTSYDAAWIDSLTRLVRQLRDTGAQVLVLGPIPSPRSWVPNCLSVHLDDVTACLPPRSTAVNQPGIATETAATNAGGGHYADVTALFCTADRCPVIVGNTLVYRDDHHVTLEYSRLLAPVMGALADRALASG
jgi:peptidoglycan/LPS O-acetylase OafA/YrhL